MVDTNVQLDDQKSMEIPLTKGYVAVVDAEDYERLSSRQWSASVRKKTGRVYVVSRAGAGCRMAYMHRFILGLTEWQRGGQEVDHINGDSLDNRRSNLRVVSRQKNMLNRRLSNRNRSGYRGVGWVARRAKWQARICTNGARTHLGYFDDAIAAAMAYDIAAVVQHGDFARRNFPAGPQVAALS
jgi:hypothetical protein